MVGIGIVGFGYWGPNYLRILRQLDRVNYIAICDSDPSRVATLNGDKVKKYTSFSDIVIDPNIDAIIIATPSPAHYTLGMQALHNGKHILVEKPVTLTAKEAKELQNLAEEKQRILTTGHVFLYNEGICFLKEHIQKNDFGKIHEIECIRQGHGPVRTEINVMWDLATHDISILLYLLGKMPTKVTARGFKYRPQTVQEDSVIMTLEFPGNVHGVIKVNWQYPIKERRVTVIGEKQMIRFSDTEPTAPVIIYHKTVTPHGEISNPEYGMFKMITSDDGYHVPVVKMREPLLLQIEDFLNAIEQKKQPRSDGKMGHDVVAVLQAATESLKNNGKEIMLGEDNGTTN